jgi:hypothetical protein
VADCFKQRDTSPPSRRHLVEFLFECEIPEDYVPRSGHHPDKHQVGVVWAGLDELAGMPLYPRSMAGFLPGFIERRSPTYLGSIDW